MRNELELAMWSARQSITRPHKKHTKVEGSGARHGLLDTGRQVCLLIPVAANLPEGPNQVYEQARMTSQPGSEKHGA